MKEKNSRQIQAENTRAHILEVFKEIIETKAFEEISIQDICKAAGISIGGFYHHFSKKSDIIVELFKEFDAYFYEEVMPGLLDTDPVEAVRRYIDLQFQYIYNFGSDLVRNIYIARLSDNDPFFREDHGFIHGLTTLLERAAAAEALSPSIPAGDIAKELLIIINGIVYNWCTRREAYNIEGYSRHIIDSYLNIYL